jgi:signal transduction histidine kinase
VRAYRRAIALKPDYAPAHNNLGVVYRNRGDTRRALECFGRAIFADPDYPIAYHNVASIYLGENEQLVRCDLPRYLGAREEPTEMVCRLLLAMVDAARADAYQRTWQEMHRVKNLLGLLGSRARSAAERTRDRAAQTVVDLTERTYDEIARRLRALRREAPSLRPTDVGEVVRHAVQAVKAAAPAKIQFTVRLAGHVPQVRADGEQLGEAIRNVLTNAVEAMPGGGKVGVAVRQERSHVEIRISDTGAGIAPEHRSSVLVPGFSTKRGGSGLGLTIARGVLFDHGGDLSLESAPGKGTTVTLRLPLGEPFVPAATQLHLRPVLLEDARQMIAQEFADTEEP